MKRVLALYGAFAGVTLPAAAAAVFLASSKGVDLGILSRWLGSGARAAAVEDAAPAEGTAAPVPPETRALAASEARAWAARLASLAREIEAETGAGRAKREADLAALRRRERRTGEAMARIAGLLLPDLDPPLAPGEWPERAGEVVGALDRLAVRQRAQVAQTVTSMDARALSDLILGPRRKAGEAAGLPDDEALALLATLTPKKAGEVLGAVARKAPERAAALAGRLIAGAARAAPAAEGDGEGKAQAKR